MREWWEDHPFHRRAAYLALKHWGPDGFSRYCRGDMALINALAFQWRELSSFYDLPEFDQPFTAENAGEILKAFAAKS